MGIPETTRVIYSKSALEKVICQLRFPPILRVASEPPAAFQDAVRKKFPFYEEKYPAFPAELPPHVTRAMAGLGSIKMAQGFHEFLSQERDWTLSLTNDFLALSTQAYIRWEGFRDDHLKEAFKRLIEIYSPAFFQRIGLRYRNVIIRSKLGLDDVPWYELLQPHIAGEMGDENISKEILEAKRHLVINLGVEVGKVRVQHFLATVTQESAKEQCYVVDADYYYDAKTEPDDAITRLNSLNKYAGRLFRWCIRDRLYEAMGPQAVE